MPVGLLKYHSNLNFTLQIMDFNSFLTWICCLLSGKQSTRQCSRHGFDPWAREDPLEEETATHPNILAWGIQLTGKAGELQSMGSQRVRCNGTTEHETVTHALLYYTYIRSVIFHSPKMFTRLLYPIHIHIMNWDLCFSFPFSQPLNPTVSSVSFIPFMKSPPTR